MPPREQGTCSVSLTMTDIQLPLPVTRLLGLRYTPLAFSLTTPFPTSDVSCLSCSFALLYLDLYCAFTPIVKFIRLMVFLSFSLRSLSWCKVDPGSIDLKQFIHSCWLSAQLTFYKSAVASRRLSFRESFYLSRLGSLSSKLSRAILAVSTIRLRSHTSSLYQAPF